MDTGLLSAGSALAGSLVGGFSSLVSNWLSQTNQLRTQHRRHVSTKREALYAEFLCEAAKRIADGMSHQAEGPEVLMTLHALINRMRLTSSREVVNAAQQVIHQVMDTYQAPNRSFEELRNSVLAKEFSDPLAVFAEACRRELQYVRDRGPNH